MKIENLLCGFGSDAETTEKILRASKEVRICAQKYEELLSVKEGSYYGRIKEASYDELLDSIERRTRRCTALLEELNRKFIFRDKFYDFKSLKGRLEYIFDFDDSLNSWLSESEM